MSPRVSDPANFSLPHQPPPQPGGGDAAAVHFRTRLAPSPTGALHLGNARTFLLTWAAARHLGWSIPLRIEDLDTPRIKPGTTEALIDTLRWLGLDWDPPSFSSSSSSSSSSLGTSSSGEAAVPTGSATHSATPPLCHSATSTPYLIQSHDLEPYRAAMRSLASRGLAYPCSLTRTEIELAASAPQEGAHDIPFPSHLRPASAGQPFDFDAENAKHEAQSPSNISEPSASPLYETRSVSERSSFSSISPSSTNWRFLVPSGTTTIHDLFAGTRAFDISSIVGDFILWTKRGTPSYQLAVVVDDLRQHITHVLRGDDLLDSAARQTLLYRALASQPSGLHPKPEPRNPEPVLPAFCHFPLILGHDHRRLAKRHGDTRLDHYRSLGVPPEAIIGLIAYWSGVTPGRTPLSAREFIHTWRADLNTIPRAPITFTHEDDQWLRSHAR